MSDLKPLWETEGYRRTVAAMVRRRRQQQAEKQAAYQAQAMAMQLAIEDELRRCEMSGMAYPFGAKLDENYRTDAAEVWFEELGDQCPTVAQVCAAFAELRKAGGQSMPTLADLREALRGVR